MTQATMTREDTETIECPLVASGYICPVTGTSTCTTDAAKQRNCSAC